jgi:signal peptidase II
MTATTMPIQSTRTFDHRLTLLGIAAVVILIDRLTKIWINTHIYLSHGITIIPNFFRLDHVLNTGAAFSVFSESHSPNKVRYFLIAFSIFAVLIVLVMLWRTGQTLSTASVALALILGGALGNLYDRIVYLHVVDFLEFHIKHYFWPSFNIADSAIVIGACLLLIEIFRPQPKDS